MPLKVYPRWITRSTRKRLVHEADLQPACVECMSACSCMNCAAVGVLFVRIFGSQSPESLTFPCRQFERIAVAI